MSKYNANKCVIDGYTFDSKIEGKYYEKLKEDKAKGLIENFELQPRFELIPAFKTCGKSYRKCEYVADFLIYRLDGSVCAIDIKGMATPEAKLKRKMFEYKQMNEKNKIELWWLKWFQKGWVKC